MNSISTKGRHSSPRLSPSVINILVKKQLTLQGQGLRLLRLRLCCPAGPRYGLTWPPKPDASNCRETEHHQYRPTQGRPVMIEKTGNELEMGMHETGLPALHVDSCRQLPFSIVMVSLLHYR